MMLSFTLFYGSNKSNPYIVYRLPPFFGCCLVWVKNLIWYEKFLMLCESLLVFSIISVENHHLLLYPPSYVMIIILHLFFIPHPRVRDDVICEEPLILISLPFTCNENKYYKYRVIQQMWQILTISNLDIDEDYGATKTS